MGGGGPHGAPVSHQRTVQEFVDHANRVIAEDDFSILYLFRIGTCVRFRDDDYVLGLGIGPDHELSADVQKSILRQFGLEELQDRFGFDLWERQDR
jgi:hypothetical protein